MTCYIIGSSGCKSLDSVSLTQLQLILLVSWEKGLMFDAQVKYWKGSAEYCMALEVLHYYALKT